MTISKLCLSQVMLVALLCFHPNINLGQDLNEQQTQAKPNSIAKLILNSQQFAFEQDYEKAIAAASEVVKREPQNARHHLALANIYFMAAEMKPAIKHYDLAAELAPPLKPHLWQRGLALYFAKQYEAGVKQFEIHQSVNSQDVENAVWHMLCASKVDGIEKARKNLIPINKDTRVPMKEIHKMFAGDMTGEQVIASVTKSDEKENQGPLSANQRAEQYYAHLYVGLFQEMTGDSKAAINSMTKAVEINPLPHNEVMGTVADVFLKIKKLDLNKEQNEKAKNETH